jgi:hypothetical protein
MARGLHGGVGRGNWARREYPADEVTSTLPRPVTHEEARILYIYLFIYLPSSKQGENSEMSYKDVI